MQYINITNKPINRDLIAELYNLASDSVLNITFHNYNFYLDVRPYGIYLEYNFKTVFYYSPHDKEIIVTPIGEYITNYNKLLAALMAYCIELYETLDYYKE